MPEISSEQTSNTQNSQGSMRKLAVRGFTLIELLIVIAIIGILIGVGSVAYSKVRKDSRDAKRKTDLQKIASSAEGYYSENRRYPSDYVVSQDVVGGVWISGLINTPIDPINADTYAYVYRSFGPSDQSFIIFANLENNNDLGRRITSDSGDTLIQSPCSESAYFDEEGGYEPSIQPEAFNAEWCVSGTHRSGTAPLPGE